MALFVERAKHTFAIAKAAGNAFLDDRGPRTGAALAFYTALSLSPLLVIAIAIAGFIYGNEAAEGGIASQIEQSVGEQGAKSIEMILANTHRQQSDGVLAIVIGAVTLFFGAMGIFGELQESMNDIWKVQKKPGRKIWQLLRGRLLAFTMVFGVGFLLLVSLTLTAIVSTAGSYLASIVPAFAVLIKVANVFVSFFVEFTLFGMIFKVLPDVKLTWRDVGIGALVTAVLFNIGKYLIVLYMGVTSVGSSFGAAGSLVALLVWIYYSTQILLFGAEVTRVVAERKGKTIAASAGAEAIPGVATPVK